MKIITGKGTYIDSTVILSITICRQKITNRTEKYYQLKSGKNRENIILCATLELVFISPTPRLRSYASKKN